MPLAGRLTYQQALPADRDQLTQRMPNGSVIKCMAVYDKPFWRQDGLSGQVISDVGPVKVVYDNSPPDGRPGGAVTLFEKYCGVVGFGAVVMDQLWGRSYFRWQRRAR